MLNQQIPPTETPAPNPDGTLKAQTDALAPAELAKAEEKPEAKSLLNQKEPTGAPEKYEAFKVPEGFTLDETVAGEASAIFKELNLTQAAGQKLVDFYAKQTAEAAEAPFKAFQDTRKEWRDQVAADPDIGSRLPQVKTEIARVYDAIGDAKLINEFKAVMDMTGAGDNPAFIKVLAKIAGLVGEGKPVQGRSPSPHGQGNQAAPPSIASAMYPNLKA